jgi:hypothetical protein
MLDLPPNFEVTDTHARICALSAYLSPALSSSSVAYAFGVCIKPAGLTRFAADIKNLLEHGFLQRDAQGFANSLTFTMDCSSDVQAGIQISGNDGQVKAKRNRLNVVSYDYLWDVAGMKAAYKALDIADEKNLTRQALQSGAKTAEGVVKLLAKGDNVLAQRGLIALTSPYENALMRVWQNAIAKMSIMRRDVEQLSRIHQAVKEGLFSHFTAASLDERSRLSSLFQTFLLNLVKELNTPSNEPVKARIIRCLPEENEKMRAYIESDGCTWEKAAEVSARDLLSIYNGIKSSRFTVKDADELFRHLLDAKIAASSHVVQVSYDFEVLPEYDDSMEKLVHEKEFRDATIQWIKSTLFPDSQVELVLPRFSARTSFATLRKNLFESLHAQIDGDKPESPAMQLAKQELDNYFISQLFAHHPKLFAHFGKSATANIQFAYYPDPVTTQLAVCMIDGLKVSRLDDTEWEIIA